MGENEKVLGQITRSTKMSVNKASSDLSLRRGANENRWFDKSNRLSSAGLFYLRSVNSVAFYLCRGSGDEIFWGI